MISKIKDLVGLSEYTGNELLALSDNGSAKNMRLSDLVDYVNDSGNTLFYSLKDGQDLKANVESINGTLAHIQDKFAEYLPKAGGTLTGQLLIETTNDRPLVLNNIAENQSWNLIAFGRESGAPVFGRAKAHNDVFYSTLPIEIGSAGNTVWHKGNMGHTSGLDADMVDGLHRFTNVDPDDVDKVDDFSTYLNDYSKYLFISAPSEGTGIIKTTSIVFNAWAGSTARFFRLIGRRTPAGGDLYFQTTNNELTDWGPVKQFVFSDTKVNEAKLSDNSLLFDGRSLVTRIDKVNPPEDFDDFNEYFNNYGKSIYTSGPTGQIGNVPAASAILNVNCGTTDRIFRLMGNRVNQKLYFQTTNNEATDWGLVKEIAFTDTKVDTAKLADVATKALDADTLDGRHSYFLMQPTTADQSIDEFDNYWNDYATKYIALGAPTGKIGNIPSVSTILNVAVAPGRFFRLISHRDDEGGRLFYQTTKGNEGEWDRIREIAFTDSKIDASSLGGFASNRYCITNTNISFNSSEDITTAQFIAKLKELGAFNYYRWCGRGIHSYANNPKITDTGCGDILLAGASIDLIRLNDEHYTIIINTGTINFNDSTPNATFVYCNNGENYVPSWRRLISNKDKLIDTLVTKDYLDQNAFLSVQDTNEQRVPIDFNSFADACKVNKLYELNNSFNQTNAPYTYGFLLQMNAGSINMQFAGNDTGTSLKYRNRWYSRNPNSPGEWSEWKDIALTTKESLNEMINLLDIGDSDVNDDMYILTKSHTPGDERFNRRLPIKLFNYIRTKLNNERLYKLNFSETYFDSVGNLYLTGGDTNTFNIFLNTLDDESHKVSAFRLNHVTGDLTLHGSVRISSYLKVTGNIEIQQGTGLLILGEATNGNSGYVMGANEPGGALVGLVNGAATIGSIGEHTTKSLMLRTPTGEVLVNDGSKDYKLIHSGNLAAQLKTAANIPTFWTGTQAQFDAIQNKDSDTFYFIEDEA